MTGDGHSGFHIIAAIVCLTPVLGTQHSVVHTSTTVKLN